MQSGQAGSKRTLRAHHLTRENFHSAKIIVLDDTRE